MTGPQILALLNSPKFTIILLLFTIWDLIWRGIALWKSSKNDSKYWFIALLVINTLGILPIIYIFFFANKKEKPTV